jgi:hypothetical protein
METVTVREALSWRCSPEDPEGRRMAAAHSQGALERIVVHRRMDVRARWSRRSHPSAPSAHYAEKPEVDRAELPGILWQKAMERIRVVLE